MMKKVRNSLLSILACAAFFGSACAALATSPASADRSDRINGVAIMPGVERLSYISTNYYGVRPTYDACVKETRGRVVDQGDCADTEFNYQDARLNSAYKALVNKLTGTDKQAAVEAQRAWLAFSSKDCSSRANRFGSDDAPANESICRMESTALRAQQLEDWGSTVAAHKLH
jgi:uncharacterized protein YecT (DUF1311 family)